MGPIGAAGVMALRSAPDGRSNETAPCRCAAARRGKVRANRSITLGRLVTMFRLTTAFVFVARDGSWGRPVDAGRDTTGNLSAVTVQHGAVRASCDPRGGLLSCGPGVAGRTVGARSITPPRSGVWCPIGTTSCMRRSIQRDSFRSRSHHWPCGCRLRR